MAAVWAYVQAHPADANAQFPLQPFMVALALASIVSGLPRLVFPEGSPGDGSHGAHLDALPAVPTPFLHGLACGLQRGIGKYSCPANSRTGVWCYQQTAFTYPA